MFLCLAAENENPAASDLPHHPHPHQPARYEAKGLFLMNPFIVFKMLLVQKSVTDSSPHNVALIF